MGTTLKKQEEGTKPVRAARKVAKKAVIKRAPAKKVTRSKPKAATTVVRTPKLAPATDTESVYVPSTASLRLLEKVEIYTLWYQKHLPTYMAAAAKVGGYAFITIGAILSSFAYLIDKEVIQSQTAALVCTEVQCTDVSDSELADSAPTVSFLNSVPATVESDIDFSVALTNTTEVVVSLKALSTGQTISLEPIERKSDSELKYLIPVQNVKSGFYTIQAETKQADKTFIFSGPTFIKPEPALVETELPLEAAETAELTLAETTVSPNEATSTPDTIQEGENVEFDTKTEDEPTDSVNEISTVEALEENAETAPMRIAIKNERGSEYVEIQTGSFTPTSVAVYSSIGGTAAPVFLGQATLVQGVWILSLSALELPVAEHLIFAAFTQAEIEYQTEGVRFLPRYNDTTTPILTSADIGILVQKIELALLASNITNQNRKNYFSYITNQTENPFSGIDEARFADTSLLSTIEETLVEVADEINEHLFVYAVAVQGGNDYLATLAAANLDAHYREVASVVAAKLADTSVVPSIHTILAKRYQVLRDAVKNSEEQIIQDTNNLTARDTDGDGLSDFDEVAFFTSDPARADSDFDGVLDGVEVVRGSDVATPDFAITESLRTQVEDVSYGEVVDIQSITPITLTSQAAASESTYALISGSTIPHASVFLLVPSINTIGLIKANSAGSFSYTLEKAIPEGKHEVTAVLLDATGQVIASSRPYAFNKAAANFLTASAVQSADTITADSPQKTTVLYILVGAVGVITFGFILLMLAASLRTRKEKVVSSPKVLHV